MTMYLLTFMVLAIVVTLGLSNSIETENLFNEDDEWANEYLNK